MPDTDHLYFVSYARDDRTNDGENRIIRFATDLGNAVNRRGATAPGFLDTSSTSTGDFWEPMANQALRTCKILVPIYSPTFFTRQYCGQEWKMFQDRVANYAKSLNGGVTPSLIMPVLYLGKSFLQDSLRLMPKNIRDVIYLQEDDPPTYVEAGLEGFMLDKYKDEYNEFVNRFATRLIELSRAYPVPAGDSDVSVEQMESAFHSTAPRKSRAAAASQKSPGYVDFLFLVGTREEMKKIRKKVGSYGDSGMEWKAFEPLFEERIAWLAQSVAIKEKLIVSFVDELTDIGKWLDSTRDSNRIAAVVVDSWVLHEPTYANLAQRYDRIDAPHSLMLVCMNSQDKETKKQATNLAKKVDAILGTKVKHGHSNFVFPVAGEDFESELSRLLVKIRMEFLTSSVEKIRTWRTKTPPGSRKDDESKMTLPALVPGG